MDFNRIGLLDVFVNAEFDYKYTNHSQFDLTADATSENSELLLNNEELRILTKHNDLSRGFIIQNSRYEDEEELMITITCLSLSTMTNWRIIEGQQTFNGNVEDVIKSFVNLNAINPVNPNRIIPGLVLGTNTGIDVTTEEVYSNVDMDIALWEICKKHDMTFEILMDHDAKTYIFNTYKGVDRSAEQSVNSQVIFSKEFDNVTFQSYVDDMSNYKSTAYIISGGDESAKTLVKVHDDLSGFNRRELFIEASDLTRTYTNENNVSITLSVAEFNNLLNERGLNSLSDYQRIRTFESDIDLYSQFIYGMHYSLGDIVTTRNDEIGIVKHSRVVRAREVYTREGYELSLEFGTSIPTLVDKIKREVRR